ELGIFGALASPLVAGVIVVNALAQSASPRLARYFADGMTSAFAATLRKLLVMGFLLGATGMALALVAGRPILLLLFRPEYAEHTSVFLWLVAAAALQYCYIFFGTAINAMRFFRIQLPMNRVGPAMVTIICAYL